MKKMAFLIFHSINQRAFNGDFNPDYYRPFALSRTIPSSHLQLCKTNKQTNKQKRTNTFNLRLISFS